MVYWIFYFSTKFLSFVFFPCRISGRENIPQHGSFLLASNHVSYLDPMILGITTGRRLNYMAKDSLFKGKFLGYVLPRLGAFPIKRNSADTGALKECFRRIREGGPLLLFPEGTRHGSTQDKKALAGVGFLAIKGGVPVVPVFIDGSQNALPPGAKFFRLSKIRVFYGKPICFKETKDYDAVAGQVMAAIRALSPDV
jgi:1-acyl-sn-glycerol-3-phosphate acyltransferase